MMRRPSCLLPLLLLAAWGAAIACRDEVRAPAWQDSEYAGVEDDRPLMCHDSVDNDQDGLTDCTDADCAPACIEGDPSNLDTCLDGLDNDQDGRSDCSDDACKANQGCCPPADQRSFEDDADSCSDGLDNDCNGYIDCNDNSCRGRDDVPFCEGTDANCADGIDNDGNGFTDCQDYGCSKNTAVTVCK
jgi:hypothetical protein